MEGSDGKAYAYTVVGAVLCVASSGFVAWSKLASTQSARKMMHISECTSVSGGVESDCHLPVARARPPSLGPLLCSMQRLTRPCKLLLCTFTP